MNKESKKIKELCVVHLVRAQNGIEPFARFLESYRQNPGGVDHDFMVVFKGFDARNSKDEYFGLLTSIPCTTIDLPDIGFDIAAYFAAAETYQGDYRYFCFLNSFSVVQDRKWLGKLYQQISQPGVGLVGATGSWESHRLSKLIVFDLVSSAIQHYRLFAGKPIWKRLFLALVGAFQLGQLLWGVKPFPNYHLRTNAFMISSETMMKLKCHDIKSKFDAYRFESGKKGMTQQVLKMGKAVLVVGKDGIGYDKNRWNESNTFRQSEQENLLVADNQTRVYQQADAEMQFHLFNAAWSKKSIHVQDKS